MFRYWINILFLLTPFCASAQQDTVQAKRWDRFAPTGVRVGTDVLALAISRWDNRFTGAEHTIDIDFSRYHLVLEAGNWGRTRTGDSILYTNDGRYWRAGVDVNFLTKDPDRNMFFIGFRYGRSTFSENLQFIDQHSVWGVKNGYQSHSDIHGRWFELTTGLRVKIYKIIWMGYTARFKFGLKTGYTPAMLPYDVPGYGRTDRESYWGFNYQVFIRIPVRKQPAIVNSK
jgi:hypothetical protein